MSLKIKLHKKKKFGQLPWYSAFQLDRGLSLLEFEANKIEFWKYFLKLYN